MNRPIDRTRLLATPLPIRRRFASHDGAPLSFLHWPAAGSRRGGVILLHRGHEHAERLAHVVHEAGLAAYDVFALDMRGHGGSGGAPGGGTRMDVLVRDLDCLARHLDARDGLGAGDLAVVGQSLGAVVAAAWVHDYAPPIRALTLVAPAFRVRLYLPLAETALRLATRLAPRLRIRSYVGGTMLTQDTGRAAGYRADSRITRDIPAALLLDLRDTARRIVADAAAITVPTQVLLAGDDRVVARRPIEAFLARLGAAQGERCLYAGLRHDLLGERDRAPVLRDLGRFIDAAFAKPATAVRLVDADRAGPSREEADRLSVPLAPHSLPGLRWRAVRAGLAVGARLSHGMAVGREAGYDSGAALDYVYRNRAAGVGWLGRLIDRAYLDAPGWRGIRQRRRHIEELFGTAVARLAEDGIAAHVLDIAAGHGRYLLGLPPELLARVASLHLRDYAERNVAAGRALIARQGLAAKARFEPGDAFDAASLALVEPRPTLAIVSGLYELFQANDPIRASLGGLARAVPPGGCLLYTNQPWHPQLELIARTLTSHRGGAPWVMRRRSQAEMDQLVTEAGFTKLEQRIDRWGIFTVSLARRNG